MQYSSSSSSRKFSAVFVNSLHKATLQIFYYTTRTAPRAQSHRKPQWNLTCESSYLGRFTRLCDTMLRFSMNREFLILTRKAKQGFPLFLIMLHYSCLWRTDVCVLTLSQLFFPFGPPTQSVSTYNLHENKPSWPGIWMKVTLFFTGWRGHFVYFKWISLVRCLLSTRISLWVSRVFQCHLRSATYIWPIFLHIYFS